jgi:hypothetical protein
MQVTKRSERQKFSPYRTLNQLFLGSLPSQKFISSSLHLHDLSQLHNQSRRMSLSFFAGDYLRPLIKLVRRMVRGKKNTIIIWHISKGLRNG